MPKIAMLFFDIITLSTDIRVHRAGSQLKIIMMENLASPTHVFNLDFPNLLQFRRRKEEGTKHNKNRYCVRHINSPRTQFVGLNKHNHCTAKEMRSKKSGRSV